MVVEGTLVLRVSSEESAKLSVNSEGKSNLSSTLFDNACSNCGGEFDENVRKPGPGEESNVGLTFEAGSMLL